MQSGLQRDVAMFSSSEACQRFDATVESGCCALKHVPFCAEGILDRCWALWPKVLLPNMFLMLL